MFNYYFVGFSDSWWLVLDCLLSLLVSVQCALPCFPINPAGYGNASVQSLSRVWPSATPWTTAHQAFLSNTNSRSPTKLLSIESVMPSNHLILCHPLILLPSILPSIRVFSNESALCIRWPKYWSFSFNISPSNEHPGLISFRMDWLDLLAVQGTLKSLIQYHSSKASILQCSAFFLVQLSHPYMTTGKTVALTRRTFVDKVMSLLFNMLSWLVITFLPRSKRLLISWLQSPSAVILEPPKIKSDTVSTVSPSICHEVMGPDAMIFVFWMLSFKPIFSLSSFTFNKRFFSSSSLSAIRVVSSAYLRLLIFLLAILIPACASSSPVFLTMYSACKLNKQGDNIQPWRTPFPMFLLLEEHKFWGGQKVHSGFSARCNRKTELWPTNSCNCNIQLPIGFKLEFSLHAKSQTHQATKHTYMDIWHHSQNEETC